MKDKKGFTLVELLVVITLIGLLVIIAVPSGLAISKKVKRNMLDRKIEIIESGAIVWGQQNKRQITSTCTIDETTYDKCITKTITDLLDENALEPDGTNEDGNEILKNPTNDEELNDCIVYVYIKNKRVYAKYDITADANKCYYSEDTTTSEEESEEPLPEGTIALYDAILRDNEITEPLTTPGQENSAENEAVLASAEDDYGTSYYFRGAVENNYVTFSNMCWRIVRVQGDGTIKLVLADRDNGCTTEEGYDANDGQSAFIADPSTQGFTYKNDAAYAASDFIYENSDINDVLNAWVNGGAYEYIGTFEPEDGTFTQKISKEDQQNLVTTEWCNDVALTSKIFYDSEYNEISETDENFDELLYYTDFNYGAEDRLANRSTAEPSLKCNFTGLDNTKSTKYESNIGILSADEVAFAGGAWYWEANASNESYYLNNNAIEARYWTMSPRNLDYHGMPSVWCVSGFAGYSLLGWEVEDGGANSIRPSVVLRSNVTIDETGDGTQSNPYIVK